MVNPLRQYVTCKYINAKKVAPPATRALSKPRLDYSFPYQNIDLDYAGPIYFKNCDHTEKMVQGYFLIITCCCTCAAHIELTPHLSIKSFLLAFRRFISGYGIPENIRDNSKTFKAVEVQNVMRYLQIKWNFTLEKSPWWGGFYERMVRSIKNTLRKLVGVSSLDYEQLNTVLVKTENVINSRPLTYMNDENLDKV